MSARRQRESASERRKDIKKAARVCVCACVETRTGYKYSYGKYTVNPSKLKIISSSSSSSFVGLFGTLRHFYLKKQRESDDNKQQLFLMLF